MKNMDSSNITFKYTFSVQYITKIKRRKRGKKEEEGKKNKKEVKIKAGCIKENITNPTSQMDGESHLLFSQNLTL